MNESDKIFEEVTIPCVKYGEDFETYTNTKDDTFNELYCPYCVDEIL